MKKFIVTALLCLGCIFVSQNAIAADVTVEAKRVSFGNDIMQLEVQATDRANALIQAIATLNSLKSAMQSDGVFDAADIATVDAIKVSVAELLATNINLDPLFLTTVKSNLD